MKNPLTFLFKRRPRFNWSLLPVVLVAVLFLTSTLLLFWYSTKSVEKLVVDQLKSQLLVLARSGSHAIGDFLEDRESEIFLLRENEAVKAIDEKEGLAYFGLMSKHLEEKHDPFAGLVRADNEGRVVWSASGGVAEKVQDGVILADRDYFLWAKDQPLSGKTYMSGPLLSRGGTSEGRQILTLSTPVFYENYFNGVVFASFLLDEVVSEYVVPLLVSPETIVSIISRREGKIIASTESDKIGLSFENCANYTPDNLENLQKTILGGREGALVHDCWLYGELGETKKLITAFVPLGMDNNADWVITVSLPYEKVLNLIRPIDANIHAQLTIGLLGFLIVCFCFVVWLRISERRAFINGFSHRR